MPEAAARQISWQVIRRLALQHKRKIVLANILAGPLVELAPQLTSLCRSGGRLVLSGILAEQEEEVRSAYAQHFELEPTRELDGWVRISGIRR